MYRSHEEVVAREKFLKLNSRGEFVIDYPERLKVIDFHTHLCNVLPLRVGDPERTGQRLTYPTLPPLERFNLHVPYWTEYPDGFKMKGVIALCKFSINGLNIFKDIIRGGTFENCFRSQDENMISRNVLLPLSTPRADRTPEALKVAREYPDRFIAFCSVHPRDKGVATKIFRYKELGAKGFKLKITDMELKNDFKPLIEVFKLCHEAKLPVLLHTGAITAIKRENVSPTLWELLQSTRVELFGELLPKLPRDFVFIFGHSGIQEFERVAEYMKEYPATYAEISCQSAESIKYLIREVGSERLLFGSDWPALPQALTLSRVLLATEGDPEARDNILYRNAERILR
ncbi:MAG: amidohydrolase family protein [Thermoanaerobacteraceae bacterium]|nr:amidohydrolase family protein [Thermoanaerobacteraceae bacterium]